MVAHAAYPEVTRDRTPASISKKWITDILRKRIGYNGLIVSDDLEMGAVLKAAPVEETAPQHIRVGGDLVLICHNEELVMRGYEALVRAAENDRRFARRVAEIAKRVEKFKRRHLGTPLNEIPAPTERKTERLARRLWELSEEVRLAALAREERGA